MQGDELIGIIARITLFSVQGVSERDTPLKLFASRLFVRPRTAGDDQKPGHDGLEPPRPKRRLPLCTPYVAGFSPARIVASQTLGRLAALKSAIRRGALTERRPMQRNASRRAPELNRSLRVIQPSQPPRARHIGGKPAVFLLPLIGITHHCAGLFRGMPALQNAHLVRDDAVAVRGVLNPYVKALFQSVVDDFDVLGRYHTHHPSKSLSCASEPLSSAASMSFVGLPPSLSGSFGAFGGKPLSPCVAV